MRHQEEPHLLGGKLRQGKSGKTQRKWPSGRYHLVALIGLVFRFEFENVI